MEFVYRMSQNSNIRDFFNKSGVDWAECSRRVAGAIRSLVNGSQTMLWKENERSRIRVVLMDNLRGLLGIRRIVPNSLIRELCGG